MTLEQLRTHAVRGAVQGTRLFEKLTLGVSFGHGPLLVGGQFDRGKDVCQVVYVAYLDSVTGMNFQCIS